ncbi:hypothetical protein Acr_17g0000900 [Actinidia rufa]|uniref:Uncharacterized protein n=1 Tax=Actinidia rufa TaxID=165716 RepID=A0A7J0G163_9ERIC|nr:hypothetical protein Acr_17g0000900 [Actinidia rufa]
MTGGRQMDPYKEGEETGRKSKCVLVCASIHARPTSTKPIISEHVVVILSCVLTKRAQGSGGKQLAGVSILDKLKLEGRARPVHITSGEHCHRAITIKQVRRPLCRNSIETPPNTGTVRAKATTTPELSLFSNLGGAITPEFGGGTAVGGNSEAC